MLCPINQFVDARLQAKNSSNVDELFTEIGESRPPRHNPPDADTIARFTRTGLARRGSKGAGPLLQRGHEGREGSFSRGGPCMHAGPANAHQSDTVAAVFDTALESTEGLQTSTQSCLQPNTHPCLQRCRGYGPACWQRLCPR